MGNCPAFATISSAHTETLLAAFEYGGAQVLRLSGSGAAGEIQQRRPLARLPVMPSTIRINRSAGPRPGSAVDDGKDDGGEYCADIVVPPLALRTSIAKLDSAPRRPVFRTMTDRLDGKR